MLNSNGARTIWARGIKESDGVFLEPTTSLKFTGHSQMQRLIFMGVSDGALTFRYENNKGSDKEVLTFQFDADPSGDTPVAVRGCVVEVTRMTRTGIDYVVRSPFRQHRSWNECGVTRHAKTP